MLQNWKQLLKDIYTPDIGSIYAIPNKLWTNKFAKNKEGEDLHPSLIEKHSICNTITYIVPGTSKVQSLGSCVFTINLNTTKLVKSYFLLKLSMPINREKLMDCNLGWDGVEYLNEAQLLEFKQQIKFCKG